MRKRSKKILFINAIFIIASFSIVTLGFSSWVVNGSIDSDSENIDVSVGDTLDKTIVIETTKNEDTDLSVCFNSNGKSQSIKEPGKGYYISSDLNNSYEDMSFTLTYSLSSFQNLESIASKVFINISFKNNNAFTVINNPNYVDTSCIMSDFTYSLANPYSKNNALNKSECISTKISYTQEYTSTNLVYFVANITQKFTFFWGNVFNNVNPSESNDTKIEDLLAFTSKASTLPILEIEISGEME